MLGDILGQPIEKYKGTARVSRVQQCWYMSRKINQNTLKLVRGRFGGLEKLCAALEILPHSIKTCQNLQIRIMTWMMCQEMGLFGQQTMKLAR